MKGKLKILIGISGAGKSTFASKLVQMSPEKYIRVNRDDIRNLLYGYNDETIYSYYERDDIRTLEKQITRFEDTLIYDGLELGKTVIVDATHLNTSYLKRFKYWNVETELAFFPIALHEAFDRNSRRSRKVPIKVMKKQFNQFLTLTKLLEKEPINFTPVELVNDSNKPKVICLDLDGTACKMSGRSPYDWKRVGEDLPDESVVELVKSIDRDKIKIIVCTGRDGICIDESEQWLDNHDIEYDEIYIRPKGNSEPDWVVKERMWRKISESYFIVGLIDDRNVVVRRARALGLKVFHVENHNF